MIAYLVFGTFEYSHDHFFGAFADPRAARNKVDYVIKEADDWCSCYWIIPYDLSTGERSGESECIDNPRMTNS